MASTSGTLANFADFLTQLKAFLCGSVSQSYSGSGNGTMTLLDPRPSIVTETWTIECIGESPDGGAWSVTGSVTGPTADAQTGVEYDNGYIRFKINDGSVDFNADSPADKFTVEAVASPLGAQTFECLKDSAVRTDFQDYTNGYITGGNITDPTTGPFDRMMYLKSTGLAGADAVYYCFTSFHSSTTFFNIGLRVMTGYNASLVRTAQPGVSPPVYMLLNNSASANLYHFEASGRSVRMRVRVGTVFEAGYAGMTYPSGSPSEFPNCLAVGGSCYTYNVSPADVSAAHRAFFAPAGPANAALGSNATLYVLARNGSSWLPVCNYASASSAQGGNTTFVMPLRALAGIGSVALSGSIRPQGYCYGNTDRKLRPVSIISSLAGFKGSYGDLEGVFHVSGQGLAAEDILEEGSIDHMAWPSSFYTDRESFAAFRLV